MRSDPGHPLAKPEAKPKHHGVPPSATIWRDRAINSSHVAGTSYPAARNSALG